MRLHDGESAGFNSPSTTTAPNSRAGSGLVDFDVGASRASSFQDSSMIGSRTNSGIQDLMIKNTFIECPEEEAEEEHLDVRKVRSEPPVQSGRRRSFDGRPRPQGLMNRVAALAAVQADTDDEADEDDLKSPGLRTEGSDDDMQWPSTPEGNYRSDSFNERLVYSDHPAGWSSQSMPQQQQQQQHQGPQKSVSFSSVSSEVRPPPPPPPQPQPQVALVMTPVPAQMMNGQMGMPCFGPLSAMVPMSAAARAALGVPDALLPSQPQSQQQPPPPPPPPPQQQQSVAVVPDPSGETVGVSRASSFTSQAGGLDPFAPPSRASSFTSQGGHEFAGPSRASSFTSQGGHEVGSRLAKAAAIAKLQEMLQSPAHTTRFKFPPGVKVLQWRYVLREEHRLMFSGVVAFLCNGVPHHIVGSWQTCKKNARQATAEAALAVLRSYQADTAPDEEAVIHVCIDTAALLTRGEAARTTAGAESVQALEARVRKIQEGVVEPSERGIRWQCETGQEGTGWQALMTAQTAGLIQTFLGPCLSTADLAYAELARRILWYMGDRNLNGCYLPNRAALLRARCEVPEAPRTWMSQFGDDIVED